LSRSMRNTYNDMEQVDASQGIEVSAISRTGFRIEERAEVCHE
jgi:hypothetical protein